MAVIMDLGFCCFGPSLSVATGNLQVEMLQSSEPGRIRKNKFTRCTFASRPYSTERGSEGADAKPLLCLARNDRLR